MSMADKADRIVSEPATDSKDTQYSIFTLDYDAKSVPLKMRNEAVECMGVTRWKEIFAKCPEEAIRQHLAQHLAFEAE